MTSFWWRVAATLIGFIALLASAALLLPALKPYFPGSDTRDALEVTFFTAQTVILIVAVVALGYAKDQIDEAREMRAMALRQARATFLLELDRRFESEQVKESVQLFGMARREEMRKAGVADPYADDAKKRAMAAASFSQMLDTMRNSPDHRDQYLKFIPFISFLETIGVMVKHDYIDVKDIEALLAGPIIDFGAYFAAHIEARQKEAGVPAGLFENALLLVDHVNAVRANR